MVGLPRDEHLQWCKDRSYLYLERGDMTGALQSFTSDMLKHSGTFNHAALHLLVGQYVLGHFNNNPKEMKKFIEDFN